MRYNTKIELNNTDDGLCVLDCPFLFITAANISVKPLNHYITFLALSSEEIVAFEYTSYNVLGGMNVHSLLFSRMMFINIFQILCSHPEHPYPPVSSLELLGSSVHLLFTFTIILALLLILPEAASDPEEDLRDDHEQCYEDEDEGDHLRVRLGRAE